MTRLLLFILLSFCCFLACKKAEEQIYFPPDSNGNGSTDTTITDTTITDTTIVDTSIATNPQLVLLETFNGFKCTNCPQADDIAQNLSEIFGEQLIVVGIHASPQFAAPTGTPPDEPFSTDFRTESGAIYWEEYGNPGLPSGMVNRWEFDGNTTRAPWAWSEGLEEIIQD